MNKKEKEGSQKNFPDGIYEKKLVLTLLLFVILTRIGQLDTTPRWDSESYLQAVMKACRAFDFTLSSYLQSFRLCGHTTYGYSALLAIGEYINPDGVYGINTVNLILLLFFTYFLYEILKYLFPESTKVSIAIGTFLILTEPLSCGTFGNINIDFPVMIFSVYMIFMHVRKYYLLFGFFTLMLIQSKEVGVVMAFGYMLSYLFLQVISSIRKRKIWRLNNKTEREPVHLSKNCRNKIVVTSVICIMLTLYILALKSGKVNSWTDGVQLGISEDNQSHYFAFVPEYIILKLKMIFLMNFYWLFCLIIFTGLLVIAVRKHQKCSREKNLFLPVISFYCGLGALLVFNCLYVTWSNPRYHYVLELGLFLGVVIIILNGVKNIYVQRCILIFLSILCLCEAYTTVDIVTRKVFECRITGSALPVVHPAWNAQYNKYFPEGIIKDMAVYNNQLGYLDRAYDRILEKVQYTEEMDVVIWDREPDYNGFSVSSMNKYWDPVKGKRMFREGRDRVSVSIVYPANIKKLEQEGKLKKKAVYICTEGYGTEAGQALKELKEYYVVGEEKSVEIFMQGSVRYYELKRKENRENRID